MFCVLKYLLCPFNLNKIIWFFPAKIEIFFSEGSSFTAHIQLYEGVLLFRFCFQVWSLEFLVGDLTPLLAPSSLFFADQPGWLDIRKQIVKRKIRRYVRLIFACFCTTKKYSNFISFCFVLVISCAKFPEPIPPSLHQIDPCDQEMF